MKRGHDLSKLMRFAEGPVWFERLEDALEDHMGAALDAHDLTFEDLEEVLGDPAAGTLWGCAFEDLAGRVFEDGSNLVDDYLKRRGWNEKGSIKLYMRAIQASVMSVHEVGEVQRGTGFVARDLVRGGEPVFVFENRATESLRPGRRVAARVVNVAGRTQLTGTVFPLKGDTADEVLAALREIATEDGHAPDEPIPDDLLRGLSFILTSAWLFDLLGPPPEPLPLNEDGSPILIHDLRFPIARGVRQAQVVERLDDGTDFVRAGRQSWSWVGEAASPGPKTDTDQEELWPVRMEDGRAVLGNILLKGRAMHLVVMSPGHAEQATALVAERFGPMLGAPSVRIQTLEELVEEYTGNEAHDLEEAIAAAQAMIDARGDGEMPVPPQRGARRAPPPPVRRRVRPGR